MREDVLLYQSNCSFLCNWIPYILILVGQQPLLHNEQIVSTPNPISLQSITITSFNIIPTNKNQLAKGAHDHTIEALKGLLQCTSLDEKGNEKHHLWYGNYQVIKPQTKLFLNWKGMLQMSFQGKRSYFVLEQALICWTSDFYHTQLYPLCIPCIQQACPPILMVCNCCISLVFNDILDHAFVTYENSCVLLLVLYNQLFWFEQK